MAEHTMDFVPPVIARAMVWLAAVAMPLQGLPAAACSCIASSDAVTATNKADEAPSCCNESTRACLCTGASICHCGEESDCSRSNTIPCCSSVTDGHSLQRLSCCQTRSCFCGDESRAMSCSCGDNCRCGQSEPPAHPATPPAEDCQSERVLVPSLMPAAIGNEAHILPRTFRFDSAALSASLPTIDRCVSLCRFTL